MWPLGKSIYSKKPQLSWGPCKFEAQKSQLELAQNKEDDRRSSLANGSSNLSFLLPLCGHAENLKIVLSQSHSSSPCPILSYWKNRRHFIMGWAQIMA